MKDRPRLTTPLVLEAPGRVPDGGGGWTLAWAPLGTHWAEIRTASASDGALGARLRATVTHRITIRSAPIGSPQRPGPAQRFRLDDRVFSIVAVAESDAAPGYLQVWAEEGAIA